MADHGLTASYAGPCWRAVIAGEEARVLDGTVRPGRYNRPGQRTLYASGSPAGVAAAMVRYGEAARTVMRLDAIATGLLDLRNPATCEGLSIDPALARADWQAALRERLAPPSWALADAARGRGAVGLIEASRHSPTEWHLVLFRWNEPGGATVTLVGDVSDGPSVVD